MRLLIADDHTLFRDALIQYIRRADPEARVDAVKDLDGVIEILGKDDGLPDLILLDFKMPGMNRGEGLRQLRRDYPDIRVALMSGVAERQDVDMALEEGAVGFFPKTLSGSALLRGVQDVLAGRVFLPVDPVTKEVRSSYYDDAPDAGGQTLESTGITPREREVLAHLAKGWSNKAIAQELDLQVVTVKLHIRSLCRKLGAENRTQTALKAHEMGVTGTE